MSLRNSSHYVWSTTWVLGKGATGTVYQGMHQTTGEAVAVKTFSTASHMRSLELLTKEFDVLTKLNHDTIVRMLAMEEEVETHKKVLIMELCTGGSLFSLLDDPQNSYGLEEAEFLCVLKDLSAGMKYLRDNSIVHRDLKPGNIMKFITEDGKSVYKLIDFGAARELEEDQQFQSLYGTEEYLHPDMYERAVLKHQANKSFKATVDLWSIGVTLYHVATGHLPFRPYGGRQNRATMYYITTQKASGVISGVQHTDGGSIEWNKKLPITCLLNPALQKSVTSLLAGILECQDEKMMSFDQFFERATDIVSRKTINVFYMNEGKEVTLYLQPNKNLTDVKDQIAAQMKVPASKQMLLFNKIVFDSIIDPALEISNYPVTTCSQPLVLLHNEKTDVKDLTHFGTEPTVFPKLDAKSVIADEDARAAKTSCSIGHSVKRRVEQLVRCRNLLVTSPKILLSHICENVTELCSNLEVLKQRISDLDQRLDRLDESSTLDGELVNNWPKEHRCKNELWNVSQVVFETKQLKKEVNQKFQCLESSVFTLKQKILISGVLQKEWDQAAIDCPELDGCIEKADTYVKKIRDCWQSLLKDRLLTNTRGLSFHEQRFHMLEKIKIQRTSKKQTSLEDECLKSCHKAVQKLNEWYGGMQAVMVQCKCLEEDAESLRTFSESYTSSINEAEIKVKNLMRKIVLNLKSSVPVEKSAPIVENGIKVDRPKTRAIKNTTFPDFCNKLDELTESQSNLRELVNEHDSLISRFIEERQSLSMLLDESVVIDK